MIDNTKRKERLLQIAELSKGSSNRHIGNRYLKSYLFNLPNELILKIFSLANTRELGRFLSTCKNFSKLGMEVSFWKSFVTSRFNLKKELLLNSLEPIKQLVVLMSSQQKLLQKTQTKPLALNQSSSELAKNLTSPKIQVLTDYEMEEGIVKRSSNKGWSICKLEKNEEEFVIKNNASEYEEYKIFNSKATYDPEKNPIVGWLKFKCEFGNNLEKYIETSSIRILPRDLLQIIIEMQKYESLITTNQIVNAISSFKN